MAPFSETKIEGVLLYLECFSDSTHNSRTSAMADERVVNEILDSAAYNTRASLILTTSYHQDRKGLLNPIVASFLEHKSKQSITSHYNGSSVARNGSCSAERERVRETMAI